MNNGWRNFLILLGVALLIYGCWYFRDLIAYILVAVVISLIGAPVVRFLRSLAIGKWQLPLWLCSLLTLGLFISLLSGLITLFGPLVADEAQAIAQVDVAQTTRNLEGSLARTEEWLSQFNFSGDERSNREFLFDQLQEAVNFDQIGNIFSNIFGVLGNAFVATFSILFISFFFLKDASLFQRIIYSATPDKYMEKVQEVLRNTSRLLTRYFIALIIQVSIFTIVISTSLWIIGIKNAFLIGFLAGLVNLIPYVGPIIGAVIGILIALTTSTIPDLDGLWTIAFKVAAVFLGAQLLDNLVVQPYIFSNSVNAHPLEIFLVISIAGSLAGIPGMILAIPGYTFIRIIAKEFLSQFKIVERLTRSI